MVHIKMCVLKKQATSNTREIKRNKNKNWLI